MKIGDALAHRGHEPRTRVGLVVLVRRIELDVQRARVQLHHLVVTEQMRDRKPRREVAHERSVGGDLRVGEWMLGFVADVLDPDRDVVEPDAVARKPGLGLQPIDRTVAIDDVVRRDVDVTGAAEVARSASISVLSKYARVAFAELPEV